MLRVSVLLLLLANGLYYAWAQGLFSAYGFGPPTLSEPQRLTQQIRPEALVVASGALPAAAEAPAVPASAAAAGVCLQAGLLDDTQAAALRQVLEPALPAGSWLLEPATVPGRWIVYMGKYPNAEAVDRKRAELRGLRVRFEALTNAALEPGLSLGGFATAEAANDEMANLARRGVRTAKVVQERPELRGNRLRLPAADEALKTRMQDFSTALAGRPLKPCD